MTNRLPQPPLSLKPVARKAEPMFGLGPPELILIMIIALVIFGPRKLPEIGQQLGKGLREFKRGTAALKEEISDAVDAEGLQKMQAEVKSTADTIGLKDIREEIASIGTLPDLKSELAGITAIELDAPPTVPANLVQQAPTAQAAEAEVKPDSSEA